MSERLAKIFSEKTIGFFMLVFILVGILLIFFVQASVNSFKEDEIRKNMTWMGNTIIYFCSMNHDQLAKAGATNDSIQVLLKKTEALEMMEDFARNNNFAVIVLEETTEKRLAVLHTLKRNLEEIPDFSAIPLLELVDVQLAAKDYSGFIVPFEAWQWTVVLLREAGSYDNLLTRMRNFYLAFAILATMLCLTILFFLKFSRQSAQLLKRSQLNLQSTLDSLVECVIVIDSDGLISRVNPAAVTTLGLEGADACLGRHIDEFFSFVPVDGSTVQPASDRTGESVLQQVGVDGSGEYLLVTRSGEEKLVAVRFTRFSLDKNISTGTSLVVSFDDITEHRRIEKQLQQAQKMEAIGQMAGGVAHDLNNILSGIVSYPELVLLRLPADSALRTPIETIKKSGERAAAVVDDMLTVARGAASVREVVHLNTLVREFGESSECQTLQEQHPLITVTFSYDSNVNTISCSPVHVKKSLLNLMKNGFEAIEESGTCSIRTYKGLVGAQQAERLELSAGDYEIISVTDSGSGISGEDIIHIFEPFYTRKKMGRSGTGLGLSVVWNTMKDHNGTVVVTSGNEGTVFELYFPAEKALGLESNTQKDLLDVRGQGERLMIVDDDPLQRAIASDFLLELNYVVEAVASGEEAVQLSTEKRFDLVILDMIMDPGINGRQTYELLLKNNPRQKAIIVSGYSESDDVRATLSLGAGGFVKKPYTLSQLGTAARDELLRSTP